MLPAVSQVAGCALKATLATIKAGVIILSDLSEFARAAGHCLPERFQGVLLDASVVVLSPVHGIVLLVPSMPPIRDKQHIDSLSDVVGAFKSISTKLANFPLKRKSQPIWHRSTCDHFIRNSDDLRNIQRYISQQCKPGHSPSRDPLNPRILRAFQTTPFLNSSNL